MEVQVELVREIPVGRNAVLRVRRVETEGFPLIEIRTFYKVWTGGRPGETRGLGILVPQDGEVLKSLTEALKKLAVEEGAAF